MRILLGILIVFLTVCCKEVSTKPNEETLFVAKDTLSKYDLVEENLIKDTIVSYWQVDYDTIETINKVKIKNEEYLIKILNFSLNDSSKVRNTDEDFHKVNYEVYHDRASDIFLYKGKNEHLLKRINKIDFKISDTEFDEYAVIMSTKFLSIKNDTLYFLATLNLPDTDWVEEVKFSVPFNTYDKTP